MRAHLRFPWFRFFRFGWGAIPGYLSLVGEGIIQAHGFHPSHIEEGNGVEFRHSEMFSGDATRVGPRLGRRSELVAGCWDYVCREMMGPDSLNLEKMGGSGIWQNAEILMAVGVTVEALTIRHPHP